VTPEHFSNEYNELRNRYEEALEENKIQFEQYSTKIEDIQNRSNAALESAQQAAAEQGVTQQATFFKELADADARSSQLWLSCTVISALALAAVSIYFLTHGIKENATNAYIIQNLTAKFLVVASLTYLMVFFSKNRSAAQHNMIANRHRQTSLQTFNALVEAADNDAAKDIILQHAANSIFQHQDSGYLNKQGTDNAPNHIQVVEHLSKSISKTND